jgi:hypothetical protein
MDDRWRDMGAYHACEVQLPHSTVQYCLEFYFYRRGAHRDGGNNLSLFLKDLKVSNLTKPRVSRLLSLTTTF